MVWLLTVRRGRTSVASFSLVKCGTLMGPSTRVRLTDLRVRAVVIVPSVTAPVLLLTVR